MHEELDSAPFDFRLRRAAPVPVFFASTGEGVFRGREFSSIALGACDDPTPTDAGVAARTAESCLREGTDPSDD